MYTLSRVATVLVVVTAAMLAGPVIASAQTPPASSPTPGPGPSPQVIAGGVDTPLVAGTVAFDFVLMDAPGRPFPTVLVDVPDGWTSFKGFAIDGPGDVAVSFWGVDRVYAHPCRFKDQLIRPGPTADDLATVLASRPLRNATAPVDVTVDGYQGKYLEWSVPDDIVLEDCDEGYFDSWTGYGTGGTGRYQQGPGQVDRLWILDVDGQRLVVDAFYMPTSTEQDRTALQRVVDSIRFAPDASSPAESP